LTYQISPKTNFMKNNFIGNVKLTSVKILEDKYTKFKELTLHSPMTLQMLVNRSLSMYLSDPEFRNQMDNMLELKVSGSNL
jgi:hypothetical protein